VSSYNLALIGKLQKDQLLMQIGIISVKGYDDDLAKKILTFLIKQGVIDLDSLKPSSTIAIHNNKRTK
jgi:hypothetical protein